MPDRPSTSASRADTPAAATDGNDGDPSRELLLKLRNQVESSLAGVQLNQARLLQSQAEGNPNWVLDIPLADRHLGDQVRLSMRRQSRQGEQTSGWSAELILRPPALGTLTVRLHLSGNRLRAVFWAENPQAAGQLNEALPTLDAALSAGGLEVTPSHCYQGQAPAAEPDFASGILDLRA